MREVVESEMCDGSRSVAGRSGLEKLSPRLLECAELYVEGLGRRDIAEIMGVKMGTVSTFWNVIKRRLHITSVGELRVLFEASETGCCE